MRELSTTLRASLASTAAFGHALTTGEARETKVAQALRPFLPERFGAVSGTVTAMDGGLSQQQDVLVYDQVAGAPFVRVGDHAVLPIEVVYASLQIKSRLAPNGVAGVVSNLASVKGLFPSEPRPVLNLDAGGVSVGAVRTKPFAAALAYEASKSEPDLMHAFAKESSKLKDSIDRPDALVLLDRGLVLWSREDPEQAIGVSPEIATHITYVPAKEDALLMMYLLLVNGLARHVAPPYSPGAYLAAAGALPAGSWSGSLAEIDCAP